MPASFRLRAGEYSVVSYGAVGDGTTDDTAAIQDTIDAVETAGGGTIYFPPGIYLVTSTLTLPSLDLEDYPGMPLLFRGAGQSGYLQGFLTVPNPTGGSVIKTTISGGSSLFSVTAPGGAATPFSAIYPVFEDLTVTSYDNPNFTAFDLRAAGLAGFRRVAIYIGGPSDATIPEPTNSGSYGVRFPSTDNWARVWADDLEIYGFYNGIEIGECFEGNIVFLYACVNGVVCTPMNHGAGFNQLTTARCVNGIVGPSSGGARLKIDRWIYEYQTGSTGGAWMQEDYTVNDPGDRLKGSATIFPVEQGVGADTHTVKNSAANFTLTAV